MSNINPRLEAAAASTRTEFEVRGLHELKSTALAAETAYHGHHYSGDPNDMEAQITCDIEDKRLLRACSDAKRTYEAALEAFVSKPVAT